jgi:uncharacterized protein (DUF58 family)
VLTSLGRSVLLASVALFGMAYAVGYADLAIPAVAGCAAVLAAAIFVGRMARLSASLDVTPVRVGRGEYARVTVRLENRAKSRSPRFSLCLPYGPEVGEVPVRSLAAAEARTFDLRIRCEHRGLIRIGPLTLHRRDLFGLCRRVAVVSGPISVRVHPVIHPLPATPSVWSLQGEGSVSRRTPLAGPTFHTLREYVPGDDLRYVHWRASAKAAASLDNLLVREHVETTSPLTAVLLDTSPRSYASGPAEAFEAAVELTASILVAAARHGHLVHLGTTGEVKVRDSTGKADVWRLLDPLVTVRAEGDRALAAVVSEMTRNPDPGTVHHGILTVVTGSDAQVPGPVLDRLLKFYRQVIIARVGREAGGHPGQEPDPRLTTRGRLLAFSAPTAADAVHQWKSALLPRGG